MIRILAVLSTAFLLVLIFPEFDIGLLAWVALVPWMLALKGVDGKAAFGLSFLAGIAFLMGVFHWINYVKGFSPVNFLELGVYLGAYYGMFGFLLALITRRTRIPFVYAAPVLWVSLEYLRSHAGFLSLPWALLGHSQYRNPTVGQVASLAGVYGVSFLIVLVNAAVAETAWHFAGRRSVIENRGKFSWFGTVVLPVSVVAFALAYGFVQLSPKAADEKMRVAVIQGNIPQNIKWDRRYREWAIRRQVSLTENAALAGSPSLIAWPETSIPGSLPRDLSLLISLPDLARRTNAHLLVGNAQGPKIVEEESHGKDRYNSAFLFSPERRPVQQYRKIRLLPFAEYLPYKGRFPWPSRFERGAGNFLAGREYSIFDVADKKFGTLICWESIFPELPREFVRNGATFLVNMTNEARFGETTAPYQFLAMNVFRAIENRVSVLRSANTGISCIIDPYGRVLGRVRSAGKDIFVEGYFCADIPIMREKTFFTKHGDLFAYANLLTAIVMLVLSCVGGDPLRRREPGTIHA